jgi:hypothetical protein
VTPEEIEEQAIEILRPSSERLERCRSLVREGLQNMAKYRAKLEVHRALHNEQEALRPLRRLRGSLEELRRSIEDLPPIWRAVVSLDFEKRIDGCLSFCDAALTPDQTPSRTPRRHAADKGAAALIAWQLLVEFDRRATTSPTGDWCRLAGILYGDPEADMRNAVRSMRREYEVTRG